MEPRIQALLNTNGTQHVESASMPKDLEYKALYIPVYTYIYLVYTYIYIPGIYLYQLSQKEGPSSI
jgi:hypothetical protein